MAHGTLLPRCTPAQAGLDPRRVLLMLDQWRDRGIRMNSFLLVRHGRVLCEGYFAPYGPDQLQTVYSLSKTFTSLAVGIAAGEGRIGLDERVIDVLPDALRRAGVAPDEHLQTLTLRHLLRMSTGQPREPKNGWDDLEAAFLKEPFTEAPGEVFRYNTIATYMLSASLKARGIDLEDYLQEKLLTPMGVTGTHWQRDCRGTCTGGFGFCLFPEVIAKLGVLILQDGVWEGRQLVPKEYLALATRTQISKPADALLPRNDWNAGYGYQMWMCQSGAFRGDGMYGQYCIMDRRTDTVLAATALTMDMQGELNAYTDCVLTAYQPDPLPEDDEAMAALTARLQSLRHDRPLPEDDGAPLPESCLNRPFPLPGGATGRLTATEDGVLLDLAGEAIPAPRGRYATRQLPLSVTADLTCREDFPVPVMATCATQGGALTVRLFQPVMLTESTLTLSPDGTVRFCLTTDPASPETLLEARF